MISCIVQSPAGSIRICRDDEGISSLQFTDDVITPLPEDELLRKCVQELDEYFRGIRKEFDLPLSLKGTEFQKKVWHALTEIPYGQTISYQELASAAGCPGGARAAGGACHRNPVWIIIPCHRVIGRNGSLTGYAGGIGRKQILLETEKKNRGSSR